MWHSGGAVSKRADGIGFANGVGHGYATDVKVVGNRIAETPREYLAQLHRLRQRLDRWNPYPRPRGQVFKFRTWEDLEKWRGSQTNPRLR